MGLTRTRKRIDPVSVLGERLEIPAKSVIFKNSTTFAYEVLEESEDRSEVRIDLARPIPEAPSKYGRWITRIGWEHMKADLLGGVPGATLQVAAKRGGSGDQAVDAVLAGRAEFLGKGDDGVVWRVGDEVVKGSTTVPFHPTNPGHRTPAEAGRMMVDNARLAEALVRAGVPGILVPRLVYVGAGDATKVFQVRPFLDLPEPGSLGTQELDQVALAVGGMLQNGIGLFDDIQVGILPRRQGRYAAGVYLYDIGKARPLRKGRHIIDDDLYYEIQRLRRFYSDHKLPFAPPPGFVLDWLWWSIERCAKSSFDMKLNGRSALKEALVARLSFVRGGYPIDALIERLRAGVDDPRPIEELPDSED